MEQTCLYLIVFRLLLSRLQWPCLTAQKLIGEKKQVTRNILENRPEINLLSDIIADELELWI